MDTTEYLAKVAHKDLSDIADDDGEIYLSNYDNSYLTRVGMEDTIKHLAELEITKELTHGVGYSPKDNKWYGWSHRAIYGFKVDSTCKEGDAHYTFSKGEWVAKTMEDAKQMARDFNEGVS